MVSINFNEIFGWICIIHSIGNVNTICYWLESIAEKEICVIEYVKEKQLMFEPNGEWYDFYSFCVAIYLLWVVRFYGQYVN